LLFFDIAETDRNRSLAHLHFVRDDLVELSLLKRSPEAIVGPTQHSSRAREAELARNRNKYIKNG